MGVPPPPGPDPTRTGATCSGNATLACFEGVQRVAGRKKGTESLSAKCDWVLQYEVNANINAVSCTNKFTHRNKQLK